MQAGNCGNVWNGTKGLNDDQVMHAMSVDDSYHVERVLARGRGGITELVTLGGTGPFVRKRIPVSRARRGVWATLPEIDCARLPHIEATYEMPDEFIVIYDYVPGETAEQLIESRGKLDPAEARRLIGEVCEAVSALHAHGIVHRDITPSNVVVAADGAHLIDFGIAMLGGEDAKGGDDQLGTWGFAAPEQYGFAKTDVRSDVYALGRLLGYLLTSVHPEDKEGYERALASSDMPPSLYAAILRATEFEPSARYQSAADLARALREGPGERDSADASSSPAPRESAGNVWHASARARMIALVCAIAAIAVVAALLATQHLIPAPTDGDAASDAISGDASSGAASGGASGGASSHDTASRESTGSPSARQDTSGAQADTDVLSVGESHWSASNSLVYAEYSLTNNSDRTVALPRATVTGYADDGSILFSSEEALSILAPGETTYQSTVFDSSTRPARVEFTPISPSADTMSSDMPPLLSTANVSARTSNSGVISVSGTVSLERDGLPPYYLGDDYGIHVTAILRDASGGIVGGGVNFLYSHPEEGSSMPFEVRIFERTDYATCEAYATVG